MSQLPEVEVVPVLESAFALDGGAMFGVVPRPLWSRASPPDEANRISMAARCLVLRHEAKVVLVDTGMGTKWQQKERDIYRIETTASDLSGALRASGVDPASITDVVLTHLHFDHAGGVTRRAEDGRIVASFPHAKHWVQRENWVWAHHPTARDAGSYRAENFAFFAEHDAPPLEFVDGNASIVGGLIDVIPSRGHTPGMQMVRFRSGGRDCVYVADLIPTSAHLPLAWGMGYDLFPLETIREKRELLEQAARHNWAIAFEHDPTCAFAMVEAHGVDRWRVAHSAEALALL